MNNLIRKYTKKPGYKIIRKIARKLGHDLLPLSTEVMGQDPFLDMKKNINNDHPVIFNVGANYGQTIDSIIEVFEHSQIYSFEPSPAVFKSLRKKTQYMKNVSTWNLGIGSSTRSLELNENTHPNMSSFLRIGREGWGSIQYTTSAPVTTIDQFCKENKIKKIDVLKIDTQGFELEVLKGAEISMRENRIGLLYFEVTFIKCITIYQVLETYTTWLSVMDLNWFQYIQSSIRITEQVGPIYCSGIKIIIRHKMMIVGNNGLCPKNCAFCFKCEPVYRAKVDVPFKFSGKPCKSFIRIIN